MSRALLIQYFLWFFVTFSSSEYFLKFYKTECVFNPEYIDNGSCYLKIVRRNLILANVDYDLKIPMTNVTAHFRMMKFYNQFRPFLINSWLSVCQLSKKDGIDVYNFFVKLFYRLAAKTTNAFVCHHLVSILYWKSFDFTT